MAKKNPKSLWLLSEFPHLLPQPMKHDVLAVAFLLLKDLIRKKMHFEVHSAVTIESYPYLPPKLLLNF